MKLLIALASAPLSELHKPQTNDIKYLSHELSILPEISKGHVGFEVDFGHVDENKPHDSATVKLRSAVGTAQLTFFMQGSSWVYSGHLEINGEYDQYAGQTSHVNVKTIARKVRALAMRLA